MVNQWLNSDGLLIKYGVTEGTSGKAGTFEDMVGNMHITEATFAFGDIPLLSAILFSTQTGIIDANTEIPAGARIEQVLLEVETAFSTGSSPTLDVGLMRVTDAMTTELDYNGLIVAAAASTIDTAGKKLTLINGSTAAGALIGTTLAYNGILTVNYNVAAFTTGKGIVRVYWYMPNA